MRVCTENGGRCRRCTWEGTSVAFACERPIRERHMKQYLRDAHKPLLIKNSNGRRIEPEYLCVYCGRRHQERPRTCPGCGSSELLEVKPGSLGPPLPRMYENASDPSLLLMTDRRFVGDHEEFRIGATADASAVMAADWTGRIRRWFEERLVGFGRAFRPWFWNC